MKKLLIVLVVLCSVSASAIGKMDDTVVITELFHCLVPVEGATASMVVAKVDDPEVDFIWISFMEAQKETLYFSQMEKGDIDEQLSKGAFDAVMMTEDTRVENGVIYNAGYFHMQAIAEGSKKYESLVFVNDNIYPMACEYVAP